MHYKMFYYKREDVYIHWKNGDKKIPGFVPPMPKFVYLFSTPSQTKAEN